MTTRRKSAAPSPRSRAKHSAAGRRLITAAKEALAHARDEVALSSYAVEVPKAVDVAAVRRRLGLSQRAFARAFGLDVTAIHAWEQDRRRPDCAARVLIRVIAREPEAVKRALAPGRG
ncbi:MAG: type II toxin-antitoxin system MqsA family antitoxin [Proteobacteria bacterium]|nr:type II toxin-antitoxin system MqsA family antitoxin [Pseudomonadota bacterium]